MERIGEIIKRRREELGLSQEELARLLGYKHKSSINKIEQGYADVPRPKLSAFASALSMKTKELAEGEEERVKRSEDYCFEQLMRLLGWNLIGDVDGNLGFVHDGVLYDIDEKQLEELKEHLMSYLDFLLNQMTVKHRKS